MSMEITQHESAAAPVTRQDVARLEQHLLTMPPVEMPVTNHFSHGVYARELFIPAGTIITGKIHLHENLNVLLSGEISVLTHDGSVKRLSAGYVEVAPPGMKRVAFAHTDTRWLTVHGTHERDVDKIEQEFVVRTEQEFLAFCDEQRLLKGE